MGLEIAGTVVAMGPEVQGFAVGDRVMGIVGGGAYAELTRIDHRMAMPVPAGMDLVAAGAVAVVLAGAAAVVSAAVAAVDGAAAGGGVREQPAPVSTSAISKGRLVLTAVSAQACSSRQ